MQQPILQTKLQFPPQHPQAVVRQKLQTVLNENLWGSAGLARSLTLFSAAAGFGKSTALRSWLEPHRRQTVWYTLDRADNDWQRFWTYVMNGFATKLDVPPERLLAPLWQGSTPDTASVPDVVVSLLNLITDHGEPLFFVVDDYHVVEEPLIHHALRCLIEQRPSNLHIIVSTRSDPPWPLARWRGSGQSMEVRVLDLAFSFEEARRLFTAEHTVPLSTEHFAALYKKTEGWIVGLHLVRLALADVADVEQFVHTFTGTHRHLLEFLGEEVLARQPEAIRTFLLQTCVLDRLSAPLCQAITGRQDAPNLLNELVQRNLFVHGLDDGQEWFRYHHLFAEFLRQVARQECPVEMERVLDTAEVWFLAADNPSAALRQAVVHGDPDRVARILGSHYLALIHSEGPLLLAGAFARLHPEQLHRFPILLIHQTFFALLHGGPKAAESLLAQAESLLALPGHGLPDEFGVFAVVKTAYYAACGCADLGLAVAVQAASRLAEDNHYWRMCLALSEGDIWLFAGNPNEAYKRYWTADRVRQQLRFGYPALSTGFKLATALLFQGKLRDCETLTKTLLEAIEDQNLGETAAACALRALFGELRRQQGDLSTAEQWQRTALAERHRSHPVYGWNCLFAIALAWSQKRLAAAEQILGDLLLQDEAGTLPDFIRDQLVLWSIRLAITQKQAGQTSAQAERNAKKGITETVDARGNRNHQYVLRQWLNITAQPGTLPRTAAIAKQADAEGNMLLHLEALWTCAQLAHHQGLPEQAQEYLTHALETGHTHGFKQFFWDRQDWSPALWQQLLQGKGRLRAQAGRKWLFAADADLPNDDTVRSPVGQPQLAVEELTDREGQVLHLLGRGLSNEEIAAQLGLALGTVRTHTSSIYGKLGVQSRAEAVALARSRGWLD